MRILLLITLLIVVCSVSGYSLETVDSLALTGRNSLAVSALLELLRERDIDSDQLLFRLTGIYHATGRSDECILLLDSIERARDIDLSGWKISLLDLSRRQEEALLLVSEDDILLRFWLTRDSDERPVSGTLPVPENIAERA
ncbi:MAG: hypothetical protein KAT47_05465, partial [Candidatus Aegiribacteria sp.]|nr:hypothetical protein [Candidatus Aegiribacteria sp.]